jgi:hypothetical protein
VSQKSFVEMGFCSMFFVKTLDAHCAQRNLTDDVVFRFDSYEILIAKIVLWQAEKGKGRR